MEKPRDKNGRIVDVMKYVRVDRGACRVRRGFVTNVEDGVVEFVEGDGRLGHARLDEVSRIQLPKVRDALDGARVQRWRDAAEKRVHDRANPAKPVTSVRRSVL